MQWVVCTTPRTGAHWLGKLLTERGFGPCDEWLEPHCPNKPTMEPFGWIIHWTQLDCYGFDIQTLLPHSTLIHLYREDIKTQARSWQAARRSHKWFGKHPNRYGKRNRGLEALIEHENRLWQETLTPHPYLSIGYESLRDGTETTLSTVIDWLEAS